jgi:hypothetical protein
MKRLVLALSLAAVALSGCAQLKNAFNETQAEGGATRAETQSPYPKSSSSLGLF